MRSGHSVGFGFSIVLEKIGTWSLDCDILLNPEVGMGTATMLAITTSKLHQHFTYDAPIIFPLSKVDALTWMNTHIQ
jgi:hypothetical protein